jgi:two-component system nitrate/nitrite response regulator NarL
MTSIVNKTALIDDSDIDLFIQRRFLEVYNFSNQIVSYQSGTDALQWLQRVTEAEAPDIIFLDLNMPDLDGFGFLEKFHQLPVKIKEKSKIVVLTSSSNADDRKESLSKEGVIHFITKPLKKKDIEDLGKIVFKESTV